MIFVFHFLSRNGSNEIDDYDAIETEIVEMDLHSTKKGGFRVCSVVLVMITMHYTQIRK